MKTLEIQVKTHIENDNIFYTVMYKDSIHSGKYLKSTIKRCLKDNKVTNNVNIIDSIIKDNKLNYLVTVSAK